MNTKLTISLEVESSALISDGDQRALVIPGRVGTHAIVVVAPVDAAAHSTPIGDALTAAGLTRPTGKEMTAQLGAGQHVVVSVGGRDDAMRAASAALLANAAAEPRREDNPETAGAPQAEEV